jgi:hypothetical protein
MSTVSPELVLGLCILGTCVATIIGYAVSRLLRPKVLNEHEESAEATNPFHEMSREQKDYMGEVRKRNSEDIWERLQVDVRKERQRQRQRRSAMRIRGGCGGEKGRDVVGGRLVACVVNGEWMRNRRLTVMVDVPDWATVRQHQRRIRQNPSFCVWFRSCSSVWRRLCKCYRWLRRCGPCI